MAKPTADDEASMPVDLRAAFTVQMYREGEVPFDLASVDSRARHGVWRFDVVEFEGSRWTIVFSSK